MARACEVKCSISIELMKMMIQVMDSLKGHEVLYSKMVKTKASLGYDGLCKSEGQATEARDDGLLRQ
jgi:hypothetical protein